ncbi:hypothetical protein [Lysobacter sp. TY2-98]|uniref:hypothetical protein n=1 Tax=Lysobacter sp. TY2-98 TaxID=2290922 RepID=UPI0013B3871C|nr:hypothetical protein [Lysobacter sp. TY2-98]
MEIIEALGAKFVALLAVAAFAYLLLALAPLLWPARRAFSRRNRLERPWLFTATVAALVYGSVYLVVAVVAIPVQAYVVFVAPQLQEMGQPHGSWLVATSRFVSQWWWPVLPVALLVSTVGLTRKLAARWAGICAVLAT